MAQNKLKVNLRGKLILLITAVNTQNKQKGFLVAFNESYHLFLTKKVRFKLRREVHVYFTYR